MLQQKGPTHNSYCGDRAEQALEDLTVRDGVSTRQESQVATVGWGTPHEGRRREENTGI